MSRALLIASDDSIATANDGLRRIAGAMNTTANPGEMGCVSLRKSQGCHPGSARGPNAPALPSKATSASLRASRSVESLDREQWFRARALRPRNRTGFHRRGVQARVPRAASWCEWLRPERRRDPGRRRLWRSSSFVRLRTSQNRKASDASAVPGKWCAGYTSLHNIM